jgi:pSer/pThr/pTyr-binding forkhead associated (FHA) protein
MIKFIVLFNNELVKSYELDDPVVTIGRLPENTICISNMGISRRHARIERDPNNTYILSDLNSLNGIFVNNEKKKKSTLSDGDKIMIGKYTILFEDIEKKVQSGTEIALKKSDTSLVVPGIIEETMPHDPVLSREQTSVVTDSKETSSVLIEINKHVVYKLDKSMLTLGDSENDDIFVTGFMVDEGHVIIERDNNEFWIKTQKLLGQIKVNGHKTKSHKLIHKDRIEIGSSTFRYMENT